jgi:acylaminoacyl-peptidase
MLFTTDIPDWCVFETFGKEREEFDFKLIGSPEVYAKLFEKSPIYHVDKVKTPTLLMIGQVDLRVPPSQGVEFYKALLARNVPTK